ncbi:MAG: FAD-binding oxidoreductase [Cyclobacteriaceae bacterium]|nr:FAD-binding oxidoreductase [Cyclobacteriaceae bacterium SS2]
MVKKVVSNWTKFPEIEADINDFLYEEEVSKTLQNNVNIIARGNGRCYGDASLGARIISTLKYDNILEFDKKNGLIHCQSGVLLSDLLSVIVPKGWFLPVTPGTKFITIGGAIASNVHGKNHHKDGAFSNFVSSITMLKPNSEIETFSKESNPELWDFTCGGMGLTGIILSAQIRLKKIESSYIKFRSIKARNLDEIFKLFEENEAYTYSMAWIDCLQTGKNIGRSILMLGEHANQQSLKRSKDILNPKDKSLFKLPFNFPTWVLNSFSLSAFNFAYYHKQRSKVVNRTVHYDGFFYPLDSILEWNKMYGRKGFLQYQFVIPLEKSIEGLREILERIGKSKFGSFLGVLKLMGKEDNSISFPIKGYTLALDFPIKNGLFEFLDELDEIVLKHGGRLYLSKDARMKKETFWASYHSAENLRKYLSSSDPKNKISSLQSKRLKIH